MSNTRDHITAALAELRASHAAQGRAISALEEALQNHVEAALNALPSPTKPVSQHRREHRPGHPPKIEADPELQAFIVARIDRMTFVQIAADVAAHFPPARGVGKTAIHDWFRKRRTKTRNG